MSNTKRNNVRAALVRALRVAISCGIAGVTIYLTGREEYAALVPLLNGLGKLLRDEFNIPYMPV